MPHAVETVDSVSVPIYHTPRDGYDGYTVVYRFAGRRHRKLCATLEEAREFAREQARNIAHGRPLQIGLAPHEMASLLRVRELLKGAGPLELVAANCAEALRILGGRSIITAAREFAQRNPDGSEIKVSTAILEFLKTKGARDRDYYRLMETRLFRFRDAFPCSLGFVTESAVDSWLAGLKVGLRTKRNYMHDVKALYRWAIRRRYLGAGFDEVERVSLPEVGPGKIQPYSPEELEKLLDYAQAMDPKFLPYLPIRAFSGIRFEEMTRLRAEHFHSETGWISMDADITKTHSRRLIPILPVLKKWLKRYPVTGPIVPRENASSISARLTELIAAAGVKTRRNGLRDSFASYRMAVLRDAGKVSEETGHSIEMLRRSYREIRMLDGRVITPEQGAKWFSFGPKSVIKIQRVKDAYDKANK